ncbi:YhhA family cyclophane-containing RiPP [Bradyrhizobium macuxiense]|uniref:YhhA family cyclophane-containing RiPP n=1 Tax=Bradyrhizobium macuxiense TaxID=1755647 RepID=UPI003D9B580A
MSIREETSQAADLRGAVLKSTFSNPALQRLQARVLETAEASEVITSYDRMHHRHSRS